MKENCKLEIVNINLVVVSKKLYLDHFVTKMLNKVLPPALE